MSTLRHRALSFVRVFTRQPSTGLMVARIYLLLVLSRAVISVSSLKRISTRLGEAQAETDVERLDEASEDFARRVGWAIHKVARYTPTNSNCYPQALTAWWLLHRKRIPSTFYFGARIKPEINELETHVWVRAGTRTVTGAGVRHQFAIVSTFADVHHAE